MHELFRDQVMQLVINLRDTPKGHLHPVQYTTGSRHVAQGHTVQDNGAPSTSCHLRCNAT